MKNKLFKKKILHRAKYRGIKELDIIFERFVTAYQEKITANELIYLIMNFLILFSKNKVFHLI